MNPESHRTAKIAATRLSALRSWFPPLFGIAVLLWMGVAIASWRDQDGERAGPGKRGLLDQIERGDSAVGESVDDATELHPTIIRRPAGPPVIHLAGTDPQGRQGVVACSTCHAVREPDFTNRTSLDLDQFHQGLACDHGSLSCYSCHNPEDADTLRLADGTKVEYRDVMTLCAQCHGTQARDYEHGAHGGMNGHWDLRRGPRTRNNCVDCHAPHEPRFPSMKPTFKPRDRFLTDSSSSESSQPVIAHD